MCAGFFLLHSKCYRPDGYLICMTLCAILNLDEMKSVHETPPLANVG